MGTLVKRLEEQLKRYWIEQETLKTWREWAELIRNAGCDIALPCPETISESKRLSYMEWLRHSESAFEPYPDWSMRVTNPSWLHRFDLNLVPQSLRDSPNTNSNPLADLGNLQVELARLIDQIHVVQQNIGGGSRAPSPPGFSRPMPLPEFDRPSAAPVLSTQSLETELRIKNSMNKPAAAPPPVVEDVHEPELVPLREAYLSFNAWCAQFEELHIHLQELVDDPLLVRSGHTISFRQFMHRLGRRVEGTERQAQMERYFKTFERMRGQGVDVNLPEPVLPEPRKEGFEAPPDSEYRDFNSWLVWLREQGYDPSEFASRPLEVPSSHRISFPQFCRRLERRLDQPEAFRQKLNLDN